MWMTQSVPLVGVLTLAGLLIGTGVVATAADSTSDAKLESPPAQPSKDPEVKPKEPDSKPDADSKPVEQKPKESEVRPKEGEAKPKETETKPKEPEVKPKDSPAKAKESEKVKETEAKPKDAEAKPKETESKSKEPELKPKEPSVKSNQSEKPKETEAKPKDAEAKPKESEGRTKEPESKPKDSPVKAKESEKTKDSESKPKDGESKLKDAPMPPENPCPPAAQSAEPKSTNDTPAPSGDNGAGDRPKAAESEPKKPLRSPMVTAKLALMADPRLFPYEIEVDARDKDLVLLGKVSQESDKKVATEIVRCLEGVHAVDNRLKVEADAMHGLVADRDKTLTQLVKERFEKSKTLQSVKFDVKTEDGIVTLSGNTRFQVIVLEAAQAARQVPGVRAVITDAVRLVVGD